MELNDKNTKKIILIIAVSLLILTALQNLDTVLSVLGYVLGLVFPFILGLCMAFVLNVVLRLIELRLFPLFEKRSKKQGVGFKIWSACRRPLAVVLTLVIIFGIVLFIMFMVIPEIKATVDDLIDSFPSYIRQMEIWAASFLAMFDLTLDEIMTISLGSLGKLSDFIGDFVKNADWDVFGTAASVTTSVFSGVTNFVLGFVFSIYILLTKEKLGRQSKALLYAYVKRDVADRTMYVASRTNSIFNKFVAGQVTEAVIIGTLCFIGMLIMGMPYAPMISVLIGFTALIPVFGALIGTVFGAFLILMIDPMQALWFVIFIVVLQQFEGNLIYPKVVGKSVGLPGLWVLFAVIVGGSINGILGMLIGVPICSVIYSLLVESVEWRLQKKNITDIDEV